MRTRSAITVFLVAGASVMAVCLLLWENALSSASELEVDPAPEKTTPAMGSVSDPIPVSFTSQIAGAGEIHTVGRAEDCELFATIVPTHMTLTSEVATRDNCTHATVCSWFDDTPTGTIILGVDPTSPDPSDWDGGSATAEVYIGDIVSPTVGILTVSWLERDGRGIHSPLKGQVAAIRLDGDLLWSKRTLQQSTFGDYSAAERGPIELTFVVTRSITHTLAFSVPAQTAWDISQVTIHLCPMPSAIRGLAYSPFRDCQTPHWGDLYPSTEEIREDMPLLFHSANALRTYSSLNTVGQIPAMAHEWDLRVSVGAWLGREIGEGGEPISNTNTEEISGAIAIANTVPVESVIVGNEVLLRKDLAITQLITYINHVRANIPPTVEVTTAETWSLWMERDEYYPEAQVKELVDAVDYILVHIHPYWDKVSVDLAATQVISQYKALQREYPEKRVVIGETGWPTAGETNRAAVPSVENQLRFLTEFLSLAEQEGVEFYYFDPFDELWKRWPSRKDGGEGESGAHWGLGYADRTAKHVLQGVLVPHSPLFSPRVYLPLIFRNSEGGPAGTFAWSPPLSSRTGDRTIASSTTVTFPVYTEWIALDNHFIPSGWMGDWGSLDFYECERANPYSGELAIRVRYATTGTQGWAGIYWQEPENNWGTIEGAGYDLDDASYLRFHARGDEGGEQVKFLMGGIWDDHPDSQQPALSTDVITLTQDWLTYTIDLRGRDLSQVIGGYGFVTDRCLNTEPITFYLDDIYYVLGGDPGTPAPTPTPEGPYGFDVYRDGDAAGNHYVPSGWMGDTGDIVLDECYRGDTRAGSTAIRVTYTAIGDGPHYGCGDLSPCNWAGVYWQDPADNWGDRPGGYDLTGARALTFWARGAKGGEKISFKLGGIGCRSALYPDSLCPARVFDPAPTILTANWQPYTIPLSVDLTLTNVVGGFMWAASKRDNPSGATFYLDDIQYLFNVDIPSAIFSSPPIPIGSGSGRTFDLEFGDGDNDGWVDIALGNHGSNQVCWNNRDGTFDCQSAFGGITTFDVEWGDLDGDGYLDLVVANSQGQSNLVCLNNRDRTFDCTAFSTCADPVKPHRSDLCHVALGDVDCDSDLDIAVGTRYVQNVLAPDVIYYNDGNGTFTATSTACRGYPTLELEFGDVDGDEDPDLAVVGHYAEYVCINSDGCTGIFTETRWLSSPRLDENTWSVAVGDAEGDGDLDVAVGRETHFDEVYLNDGSGGFPGKLPFDPVWEKTWDVAWGDVDGDGDLDLALGNSYRSTVIYSNEPVTSSPGLALTRPIVFGAGVYRSLSVAFGDVDRDCDLDLATTRDGGQNVIYLNSSLGCHVYPPIFMNSYPSP